MNTGFTGYGITTPGLRSIRSLAAMPVGHGVIDAGPVSYGVMESLRLACKAWDHWHQAYKPWGH